MTLIIEDGSNVANANSYASTVTLRAYALLRGVVLPVSESACEALAIKAMDEIESRREEYQGMKANDDQALQYPRAQIDYYDELLGYVASTTYGIFIDSRRIAVDEIPQILIDIQAQLCMAIYAGVDFANYKQSQKFVVKRKLGPIETVYSENFGSGNDVRIESIEDMFDVLIYPYGKNNGFMTVKV